MLFLSKAHLDFNLLLFPYLHFISFITKNKLELEWQAVCEKCPNTVQKKAPYLNTFHGVRMLQLHKKRFISNELMKTQKWRLRWCIFLFIIASNFCLRLEPFYQTILGWVCVKCSYFLKPCCNYIFQFYLLSISKKEKDECEFHAGVLRFYKFWLEFYFTKVLFYRR